MDSQTQNSSLYDVASSIFEFELVDETIPQGLGDFAERLDQSAKRRKTGFFSGLKEAVASTKKASKVWSDIGERLNFESATDPIGEFSAALKNFNMLVGKADDIVPQVEGIFRSCKWEKIVSSLLSAASLSQLVFSVFRFLKMVWKALGWTIGRLKDLINPQAEEDDEESAKRNITLVVSIVISSLLALLGAHVISSRVAHHGYKQKFSGKLYTVCSEFIKVERNVGQFVGKIVGWIQDLIGDLSMRVLRAERFALLQAVKNKQHVVAEWAREVQYLNSYSVKAMISQDPCLGHRVVMADVFAKMLQANLLEVGAAFPELVKEKSAIGLQDMIKVAGALRHDLDIEWDVGINRSPPMSVLFVGPTNIGKTAMVDSFMKTVLARAGIGSGIGGMCGPHDIFHRNLTIPYWNGVQPGVKAVLYDEVLNWSNGTDPGMIAYLGEMFGLGGSAVFNVNMAHLSEKKTCIAPKLLVHTSNSLHCAAIAKHITNSSAFWRRYSYIVSVQAVGAVKSDFSHLRFRCRYQDGRTSAPSESDFAECPELDFVTMCDSMGVKLRKNIEAGRLWQQQQEERLRQDIQVRLSSENGSEYRDLRAIKCQAPPECLVFTQLYSLPYEEKAKILRVLSKMEKDTEGFKLQEAVGDLLRGLDQSAYSQGPGGDEEELLKNEIPGPSVPSTVSGLIAQDPTNKKVVSGVIAVKKECAHSAAMSLVAGRLSRSPKMRDGKFVFQISTEVFDEWSPRLTGPCIVINTGLSAEWREVIVDCVNPCPVETCPFSPKNRRALLIYWTKMDSCWATWTEVEERFPRCLIDRFGLDEGGGGRNPYASTVEVIESESGCWFTRLIRLLTGKRSLMLMGSIGLLSAIVGMFFYFRKPHPIVPEEIKLSKYSFSDGFSGSKVELDPSYVARARKELDAAVEMRKHGEGPRERALEDQARRDLDRAMSDELEGQSAGNADSRALRSAAAARTRLQEKIVAVPQSGVFEAMQNSIIRNICWLRYVMPSGQERSGRIVALAERICIVPRHYVDEWEYQKPKDVYLSWQDGEGRVVDCVVVKNGVGLIEWRNVDDVPSLSFLRFPKVIPNFPDIRRRFVSKERFGDVSASGVVFTMSFKQRSNVLEALYTQIRRVRDVPVRDGESVRSFVVRYAWEHCWSRPGLCGSLLYDCGTESIIGIHVAGTTLSGRGFCEALCREWLDGVLGAFQGVNCVEPPREESLTFLPEFERLFVQDVVESQMDIAPSLDAGSGAVETNPGGMENVPGVPSPAQCDISGASIEEIVDRYLPMSTGKWSTSDTAGKRLVKLEILDDLLTTHKNAPQLAILRVHRYARFDLDIKVSVNGNRRQSGCLLAAFMYGADADPSFSEKNSFASRVQGLSGFVQAARSRLLEFTVPFCWIKDFIDIAAHDANNLKRLYGSFLMYVVNPLEVHDGGTTYASYTIWTRIRNIQVKGPMHSDLVTSQMMSVLPLAARALNWYCKNRDRPGLEPRPTCVKAYVCDNMAMGAGVPDSSIKFRLRPADLPQKNGSATSKRALASTFGFLSTFEWNEFSVAQSLIASFHVAPATELTCSGDRVPTPLEFLGCIDSLWRGDIIYHFQCVCPAELTGRLLVAVVFRQKTTVTYAQACVSPHIVIDLDDVQDVYLRVPFVCDGEYMSTLRSGLDARTSLATLHCFVQNELVSNVSITNKVRINVYHAGADNFESLVPRFPLCYPAYAMGEDSRTVALPFVAHYSPAYVGVWRNSYIAKLGILRYGETTDHVSQFQVDKVKGKGHGSIWKISPKWIAKAVLPHGQTAVGLLFVISGGYAYAHVFATADDLDAAVAADTSATFIQTLWVNESSLSGDYWPVELEATFYYALENPLAPPTRRERDEVVSQGPVEVLLPPVSGTQFGQLVLGEEFQDLKDYARRFSLVAGCKVGKKTTTAAPAFVFPVFPQGGLAWRKTSSDIQTFTAKTLDYLQILSSGFYMIRGGVRYKIVPSMGTSKYQVLVHHRPHVRPAYPWLRVAGAINWNDMPLPGEAAMIFHGAVAAEFEIPHYGTVDRHFAFPLLIERHMNPSSYYQSLGEVGVSLVPRSTDSANFLIYQAAADDWDLEVFQGLPLMHFWNGPSADTITSFRLVDEEWGEIYEGESSGAQWRTFEVLGSVVPLAFSTIPSRTSFIPTPAQGELGTPRKAPAILSSGDQRWRGQYSPLAYSVEKHLHPPSPMEGGIASSVIEMVTRRVLERCTPLSAAPRLSTIQEAILGRSVPGYSSLDLSTGSGFLLRNLRGGPKSAYITVRNGELIWLSPLVQELMIKEELCRRRGQAWPTVFVDCLKDELKEIEKVTMPGKTRVFSMCPLTYVLRARQLFMEFAGAFQASRMQLEHAIGINPDGEDWGALFAKLAAGDRGHGFIEGDYSCFDGKVPVQFVEAAYDIIIKWSELHIPGFPSVVARCLAYEATHPIHLAGRTLYRPLSGQPSGNPLTAIVNSLVNMMLVRYAWCSARKGSAAASLMKFEKNITLFVYGDDLIASTRSRNENFHAGVLACEFRKLGIVFTGTAKGEAKNFVTVSEASFLKRGFRAHPTRRGQWLAPLDWVSVTECALWMPRQFGPEAVVLMVEDSVRLAYTHGPRVYTKYKDKCEEFLHKIGLVRKFPSWTELDARVYEGEKIINLEKGVVVSPEGW